MVMKNKLVERFSGKLHYYVNPCAASEIFFDNETIRRLCDKQVELSVTGISSYLRNHNDIYFPILLTWDMTSRCNFSCPFCYIRDNSIEKEVCFEEVKDAIDGLVEAGLFEVFLSGGECLLLNDFIKIYKYFKEKGVFVTVFTNGSLIDDEIISCWNEFPPCSVEITLYDDDFTSKPYCNIQRLLDMGIYVLPKFTLTRYNLCYVNRVKEWMEKHNLSLVVDSNIFDGQDEMHSKIKEKFSLTLEEKKQYTPEKIYKGENIYGVRTGFPCKSKNGIIQISPQYTISLCSKMKIRWDLRKVTVAMALSELRELIKKYESVTLNGCNGCVYSKRCDMCYANAEIINGELYVPLGYCDKLRKELEME